MEPKLLQGELQVMEEFWKHGRLAIREIQESFPESKRPPYTSIQTIVNRLEEKGAVKRVRKIGNAHIFEAVVSRSAAQRNLVDELLSLFGGRTKPIMAHLVESGKLTLADVQEAETALRELAKKEQSQ